MQVHITARHLELTPAIADYANKKIERVARRFKAVLRAQVVLSVEKLRHIAEVIVHAQGHHDFRAKEVSGDLYSALDLVTEKLNKHMARQKDRRVRGRRGEKSAPPDVLPTVPAVPAETAEDTVLSRISRFTPLTLTVAEAAAEMERHDYDFLLFLNGDDLNVLYRRKDKTYGLLEPNLS